MRGKDNGGGARSAAGYVTLVARQVSPMPEIRSMADAAQAYTRLVLR
jgi:hypothetical protein